MDSNKKKEITKEANTISERFYSKLQEIKYPEVDDENIIAVGAGLSDCYVGYKTIYDFIIPELFNAKNNKDLDDLLMEYKRHLEHIRNHIDDAIDGIGKIDEFLDK